MFWQSGDTPLHVASRKGNVGAIQLLLQKGANINEANNVSKHYTVYIAKYVDI